MADFIFGPGYYSCQSSDERNRVAFGISLDDLVKTMKSASVYQQDQVFFTLKQQNGLPFLQFKIKKEVNQVEMAVVQNVPLTSTRVSEVEHALNEPDIDQPHVYILLPRPAMEFQRICDRYRRLGSHVRVTASTSGLLRLELFSDDVRVETVWEGLDNPQAEVGSQVQSSPLKFSQREGESGADGQYSIVVSTKDWYQICNLNVVTQAVVMGIVDEDILVAYGFMDSIDEGLGKINYYVCHVNV